MGDRERAAAAACKQNNMKSERQANMTKDKENGSQIEQHAERKRASGRQSKRQADKESSKQTE